MNQAKPEDGENIQISKNVQQKLEQALALHQQSHFAQAKALYDEILQIQPQHFNALHLSSVIALQTNEPTLALELTKRAIEINPEFAIVHYNQANALKELGQNEAALQSFDTAIALKPDFADAYFNRGIVLRILKQYEDALLSYDKAIEYQPGYVEAYFNRGNLLRDLKQFDAALLSFNKVIELKPDYFEAYINRGSMLMELKQLDVALLNFDNAIAIKPDYADAYCNRGNVLKDLGRFEAALHSYDKAVELKPDFADAYYNRGNALRDLKRYQSAIENFDKALALKPSYEFVYGYRLHSKMHICDWDDLENQLASFIQSVYRSEIAQSPFSILAISNSLPLQQKAAEIWTNKKNPARFALPQISKRLRREKIRIGYFSADFHNHATAYLIAELFEEHDKDTFELVAFSFGPDRNDEMRKRIVNCFDKFIDVRDQSDQEIAQLSRNLGIDIAVDLKGFTQNSRVGIFAYRAAPIQVSYLGYPGTMGAKYIDYLIADNTVIPEVSQQYYSEKIVYLPHSYQVNDGKRAIAKTIVSRKELGLPDRGFVFCCFNNNYKITPATFDGWMRILKQVEGSVLWLFEGNPIAAINLRKEAITRGVNEERLVFAKSLPLDEHLARLRAADLFIDTLPCNAHTTASDALWAGLPVLTCMADAFASRVAASLLKAIGLPELIASSQAEYEALAIELARNTDRLQKIKQKLESNRNATPLFDSKLFARNIEGAYTQMIERYYADLPPEHIYVTPAKLIPDTNAEETKITENSRLAEQISAKYQQAFALHQQGQLAQAKAIYEEILNVNPRHFDSLHLLGILALQSKNYSIAADLINRAIAINPQFAAAYNNLATALKGLNQLESALQNYDKAIELKPDYAEAFFNRSVVQNELKQFEAALHGCDRAIALNSDFAEAYNNRGNILKALKQFDAAVLSYDDAIARRPDYVDALFNRGLLLADLGQHEAALQSFDMIISLRPDHASAYNERGKALKNLKHYAAALQSYDKAIALQPDFADGYYNRGVMLFRSMKQHEAAKLNFKKVIELKPDYADAYACLANIHVDMGLFETAQFEIAKALEFQPENSSALTLLPRLRKMTAEDKSWLKTVLGAISRFNPALSEQEVINLQFALGKFYDDTKQYDLAFAAFQQGNQLKRKINGVFDRAGFSKQIDELMETYSAEAVFMHREEASRSECPILIVGMPRSGTTLIEQIIITHPEAMGGGELPFWELQAGKHKAAVMSGKFDATLISSIASAFEQLLQHLSLNASRVVDKTPSNFIWLGFILSVFPQAKIIHSQRNPVDTCLSIYFQNFEQYFPYETDIDDITFYYREYSRLMQHWRKVLPTDRFLEVPYEALVDDQTAWSQRIVEFVGLDWDERCLDFHKTERKVLTASNWQVKQKIYTTSKARWRNYEPHLGALRGLLEPEL